MKRFYTLIKFKETQFIEIQKKLYSKDMEIQEYKEKALKIENEIKKLKHISGSLEYPEMHSIIENLKQEWIDIENKKQEKIANRNDIFSELMIKKQEIKSIEMLIEKKKKEQDILLLKKEQDNLDELNALE